MTGVKPDEDIRRPMQWSGADRGVGFTTGRPWRPAANDYRTVNVAAQTADPDSLLNLYRNLIHLRNAHPALRTGETLFVDADTQRLYAILRYDDQDAFLILVNSHPRALTTDLYSLSLEAGPFTGPVSAASVIGLPDPAAPVINAAGGFSNYQPFVEIPPQTAVVIKLTR